MLRRSLRDAAVALSLANLFFIGAWIPILDSSHNWPNKFHDVSSNNIFALVLDVLLLGAVFFAAISSVRRLGNKVVLEIGRWAFVIAMLGIVSVALLSQSPDFGAFGWAMLRQINYFNITELRVLGSIGLLLSALAMMERYRWTIAAVSVLALSLLPLGELQAVGLMTAIIVTFVVMRWHSFIVKAAVGLALIFVPLVFLTIFQSISILIKLSGSPTAPHEVQASQTNPRVVWIIFDEMDYLLSFGNRPATLELPEFDRFRDQSFHANNAYPPSDYTLLSMPALITGQFVTRANPSQPAEVMLSFEGATDAVTWSSQPNIFSRSLELGVNTGLVGSYHPYQKIIGRSLTVSYVREMRRLSLPKGMLLHLEQPFRAASLFGLVNRLEGMKSKWERGEFLSLYRGIMDAATKAATTPELGLVLIHNPIPHPPGIYNRAEGKFEMEAPSSYLDGLALADRSLGEIRRAMEEAGLWESSFVLISSDHWWRSDLWKGSPSWSPEDDELSAAREKIHQRIPFLVKASYQANPMVYDAPFNTVLTHDLLLSILRGELSDPASVGRWIDDHRSIGESPYSYERSRQ